MTYGSWEISTGLTFGTNLDRMTGIYPCAGQAGRYLGTVETRTTPKVEL